MPDSTAPERHVSPAQVADLLDVSVDEVMALIHEGELRAVRVGPGAHWRIAEGSVADYLDAQREEARRIALWRQSNAASFPELWGTSD